MPEIGNPYLTGDPQALVLPPSTVRSSDLLLPPATGEALATLSRARINLREVFSARLRALRRPARTSAVDLTGESESESDSQSRLERLFEEVTGPIASSSSSASREQ